MRSWLKPLASSAMTEVSRLIKAGSHEDPTATLFGNDVAVIPLLLFLPIIPCRASPHTSYLLIPKRGIGGMVLPSWLCFSSGVILETRSAALSLKEYEVLR